MQSAVKLLGLSVATGNLILKILVPGPIFLSSIENVGPETSSSLNQSFSLKIFSY